MWLAMWLPAIAGGIDAWSWVMFAQQATPIEWDGHRGAFAAGLWLAGMFPMFMLFEAADNIARG
jgi:hypothetical protein